MTQSSLKSFRDTLEAVVVALLLAFVIRAFVVQAFKIPSGSMLDTLQIGDHLLVSKFAYDVRLPSTLWLDTTDGKVLMKTGDPKRGDIIVFKFPEDETKDFIKRVIGLPGDTLEVRNKVVYINGQPLDEPYVLHTKSDTLPVRDNFGPVVVPEGQYFVMGDNREGSYDSRWWGPVKRQKIVGKALVIYWSWGSLTDIRFNRIGTMFH
ncbi:MAG: signal peptidase I [Pseudodesulfovibrio sp.]|uniref:Signal peptidase I n=1 Tax=Pseudodesulfovibrio indicus TaxID=1716143 RepID=A0A126QKW5_9BACT|nr:signal peptidase I [Pseudodesulfovibrio indicus]AMK10594.1 S26 family signal peptidase [Pseudodesulfovibrio indicus]TDT82735.1 signal peptidase I [Pseudodesulfovibrio indicus]